MAGEQKPTPGRIVLYRPPDTSSVQLPAIVVVNAADWTREDRELLGALNWPDPPEKGRVHLAVLAPVVGRELALAVNVAEGDKAGTWAWPERT